LAFFFVVFILISTIQLLLVIGLSVSLDRLYICDLYVVMYLVNQLCFRSCWTIKISFFI